jgi:parallel beta-helix repeat protein
MKRFVSGLMLILLITSMLAFVFNVQPVKGEWTGTVYIRADGSIDPPDAPIITYDNVTYTLTDNITSTAEGIVVQRNNIIIDGAGYTLQGVGIVPRYFGWPYIDPPGICIFERINVTVKNMRIMGFPYGIYLHSSHGCTIYKNNLTSISYRAIVIYEGSANNISRNRIEDTFQDGIALISSNYNTIADNLFFNTGIYVIPSYGNVVVDNFVNGKPLVYLEGISDFIVNVTAGQLILIECTRITVENLNLSNTNEGIQVWYSNNIRIANNIMTNNTCVGIWATSSSSITILDNYITNSWFGIYITYSEDFLIKRNSITKCISGIDLRLDSNFTIVENNITNSDFAGIVLMASSNNRIYHNNFINNAKQVGSSYGSINIWDDGYPSGGNYWSDYTGVDLYSGPFQNETGSDGIGDTPYVINENNTDRYPLMSPYGMGAISGKVTDALTGERIASVSVRATPSTYPFPYKGNLRLPPGIIVIPENAITGIEEGNLTISSETTLIVKQNATLIWNPGYSIILEKGGQIILEGGSIRKGYFYVIFDEVHACWGNPTYSDSPTPPQGYVRWKDVSDYPPCGEGWPYSTTTDSNGNYILTLPEGRYDITTFKDGYKCKAEVNITVTANRITTVNFALERSILPLTVSISPMNSSIFMGQSVSFTSTVSGGCPPYNYQWYLNGSAVSGATLSTWTFTPLSAGTYHVYLNVSDIVGNVAISETATITVALQLVVTISPLSASILVGQSVAFTSTTTGGFRPYTYQWYLNGNPVSGATSETWTFTPSTSGVFYVYLKVTDSKGNTAQSETARITVSTVPVGGYSIPTSISTNTNLAAPYLAILAILTISFTVMKRKATRK